MGRRKGHLEALIIAFLLIWAGQRTPLFLGICDFPKEHVGASHLACKLVR